MTDPDLQPLTTPEWRQYLEEIEMQHAALELGIYLPASVLMKRAESIELMDAAHELGLELRRGR
jgi:hypothetical protein